MIKLSSLICVLCLLWGNTALAGPALDFESRVEGMAAAMEVYFMDNMKYPKNISSLKCCLAESEQLKALQWEVGKNSWKIKIQSVNNSAYTMYMDSTDLTAKFSATLLKDIAPEKAALKQEKSKKDNAELLIKTHELCLNLKKSFTTGKFNDYKLYLEDVDSLKELYNSKCISLGYPIFELRVSLDRRPGSPSRN